MSIFTRALVEEPRRRLLLRAAGLPLVAALTLAPVAANAETFTHKDATGDLVYYSYGGDQPVVVPTAENGDIRTISGRHTNGRVVVKVAFRDLSKTGGDFSFLAEIRTSSSLAYGIRADVRAKRGTAKWSFGQDRAPESCRGFRHSIDWERKKITVSVPRRCIDSPRWVRLGASWSRLRETGAHIDYAIGQGESGQYGPSKFGPRLSRG